jgi:arylsulfatase A-like enzyme
MYFAFNKMKPNILFIIIDSMRSDKFHNKLELSQTPNINSLIQKGAYFNQNFGSSDYSVSGYGCIFSSLYPINAGISGMSYHKIFSKIPNYINQLKNSGYHAYSLVDTWSIKLGLADFENEDKDYDRATLNLFNGLGNRILDKLESNSLMEPWFYLIHIEDLHIPVSVPKKFKSKKYSERYDFVVSEIDSWIGKIIEKVDLEKTLVVITADHGDYILSIDDGIKETFSSKIKSDLRNKIPKNLYDKVAKQKRNLERSKNFLKAKSSLEKRSIDTRTSQERYLFDDLIHIPLLFLGHGIPSIGIKNDLVRSIDIFPTIAEIIDLNNPDQIDGRSLLPLLNGKNLNEEPVYLENTIFETNSNSPKPCIGLRSSKFKYFRRLDLEDEQIFLYDLVNDPLEENNIASLKPELVKTFEQDLFEKREKLLSKFNEPELNDEETKNVEEELKKLGYI